MNIELYLLWSTQGWGVYGKTTCPDPHDVIPDYCYRKYEVPSDKESIAFQRLLEVKSSLVERNITPDRQNQNEIFPTIEDLIK